MKRNKSLCMLLAVYASLLVLAPVATASDIMTLQCEDYRDGSNALTNPVNPGADTDYTVYSYFDTTAGSESGIDYAGRNAAGDDVDFAGLPAGERAIGHVNSGEWFYLSGNAMSPWNTNPTFSKKSRYKISARVASGNTAVSDKYFEIYIDGVLEATVPVQCTGGWDKSFFETTISVTTRNVISAGVHTVKFCAGSGCYNIDWISFEPTVCHSAALANQVGKYNVLFIAVDDLRPELGCYGVPDIKSPNIDALARRGTVFNRAYCQQAICGPSRSSVLTGRRPDTIKVWDCDTHFRAHCPDLITLPQYFKQHRYYTQSFGKVFHDFLDDPPSWSAGSWAPNDQMYGKQGNRDALKEIQKNKKGNRPAFGVSWEDPDVPDNALRDGMLADRAIKALNQVKDNLFFLAVGFYRPHLPFVAPKKYYDLYKPEDLRLANNPYPPEDVPSFAMQDSFELRFYSDIPNKGPISGEKARELIHGYYACVSYVDVQIGRVLAELDRLGLRERTVVVLWGDHGWQLGDHGIWCKQTNFEVATRAPLIISAPGQKNAGAKTEAISEFIDIYPTLVELSGLPLSEGLEGTSLVPVMNDPDRPGKEAAFSQYPRANNTVMGYSMRTDRYRYTEWDRVDSDKPPVGVELYDHEKDPGENVNLAGQPEYKDLIARLSKQLHANVHGTTSPDAKR